MEPTFLSATILLILITDPLGNIPLFIAALRRVRPDRHSRVILRECLISFSVMLAFMVFGRRILAVMNLTDDILRVAGGVILFLIALKMVFPEASGPAKEEDEAVEPFIVPIAIPLISGPSAMATAMLIAGSNPRRMPEWIAALALSISVTFVVFRLSTWLQKRLGEQVITAMERLMGLILTAISIEMLLHGVAAYVKALQT
ncbi:MarC family protein [Geothrix sp. PMB-07]|uniref:MarC family protein n=1 Tax=Geothrix sp. PMB-07 TaxID=3068640 RepID=UPI002740DF97|nr:MarC family protein [Geothrix sp. PMB-07]WLT30965.1 MarC family protein [Geothrix sp. PMB-07]